MKMYQFTNGGKVKKLSDGSLIPPNEKNMEWREYLDWVEAGGVPDPISEGDRLQDEREAAMLRPADAG